MGQALDEEGHQILTVGFPYDELDDAIEYGSNDFGIAAEVLRKLLVWQYQDGSHDERGARIRWLVLRWVCLKELHHYSMSDLARKHGLHKQSLGRWVDDFKRTFPYARTEHMR